MSDILRQVDEDIRKEQFSKLWKKYGLYSVLALILVFVLVIGYQLKISIDKTKNEKIVELYINATNIENIDQQLSLLDEINTSNNRYLSGLADLKISRLMIENGNADEGSMYLEKIALNKTYDPIIRDLSIYFLLMIRIDNYSEDEFLSFLDDAKIQNSNFKFLFKELIALKKLLVGKNKESKIGFQELIDLQDTPTDIKLRAEKFLKIADQHG